jgi:glycolate oxidase
VKVGGVLSGEHGVGIEKRDLMTDMFAEPDLEQQHRIKCAIDPQGLFNPGKVFPTLSACIEQGHLHVHGAQMPRPDLPRF